ncbi:hypothetical protein F2Q68_00035946 [Brassica cretica]|uniref:Uncharacterized protein n=1 Tax=Brassica cretica TaxID=69181 RepID=A0A8S9H4H9_BRACR|nr:hypothetical protein F2Q68_00035946 [Brassica cretica]
MGRACGDGSEEAVVWIWQKLGGHGVEVEPSTKKIERRGTRWADDGPGRPASRVKERLRVESAFRVRCLSSVDCFILVLTALIDEEMACGSGFCLSPLRSGSRTCMSLSLISGRSGVPQRVFIPVGLLLLLLIRPARTLMKPKPQPVFSSRCKLSFLTLGQTRLGICALGVLTRQVVYITLTR